MSLKLMYITNRPDVALIAEQNGVNRIFVDMEYIGKTKRQGGLDSVQNHHTIEDVKAVREVLTQSELLVRINPIHAASKEYPSSKDEIEAVVKAGADIIMLPYSKTVAEVQKFIAYVDGRVRTMLLLETAEAVSILDAILQLEGIDEIHIGLNDLSISYGNKFMFELLSNGTVENLCNKLKHQNIFYGFGGIASLGRGLVPAELIIKEHYRLGSHAAILSRSFCNVDKFNDLEAIREIFFRGIREIRALEKECAFHTKSFHTKYFSDNKKELRIAVDKALITIENQETT